MEQMISSPENKNISLEEYRALSEAQASRLLEMTATPEDQVLQEFNKKYAIVRTSTTYILVQKNGTVFELDSRSSFLNFHENDFFLTSEGKSKNKAAFWLKHPKRRTYENIIFDPIKSGDHSGCYNIFKGFSVIAIRGSSSLFWKHVKEVICFGSEEFYSYVRKWMACVVQRPSLLSTALVLRGLQGTGKNMFVDYFGKIFGPYFLTVTSLEHICGKFNNHLKYAYLIHANEAIWGGSKKEAGAIKALITDPTIIIEGKGKDPISIDNCRHLVVSSNEDWAVPMDLDDRRFFVLDVSSHQKGNLQYFEELQKEMYRGGLQALLYDLLHEDLSDYDPRCMPVNDQGFDIKMRSSGSIENYLYFSLKEGTFDLSSSSLQEWGDISCEELHQYYRNWCRKEGIRIEAGSEVGKKLKKLLLTERVRRTVQGRREWWYVFPSLVETRAIFEKFTRQTEGIWND
jgi:hypothetical protein